MISNHLGPQGRREVGEAVLIAFLSKAAVQLVIEIAEVIKERRERKARKAAAHEPRD